MAICRRPCLNPRIPVPLGRGVCQRNNLCSQMDAALGGQNVIFVKGDDLSIATDDFTTLSKTVIEVVNWKIFDKITGVVDGSALLSGEEMVVQIKEEKVTIYTELGSYHFDSRPLDEIKRWAMQLSTGGTQRKDMLNHGGGLLSSVTGIDYTFALDGNVILIRFNDDMAAIPKGEDIVSAILGIDRSHLVNRYIEWVKS